MKQQLLSVRQSDKNPDNPITAVIYIRVSTDEQAQKGYSQRSQEERLRRFCQANNIKILQTVFEDHSAKTFRRPAWTKLMWEFKQSKYNRPQLVLFTRWDRFSRNAANAYYMINMLQKLGIEPQASDQPLDLSIPEDKVLLAIYIIIAEVENERRSLNIRQGLRRAQREGYWIGNAPIGYVKTYTPAGQKIIVPHEPEASLVREIFTGIDEQVSVRSLYRKSVEKGLRCSLSTFWNLLRNPVYCGQIRIPPANGTIHNTVKGNHEGLIHQALFDNVQTRLNGKRTRYKHQSQNELLHLHGFLYCPKCAKRLLASGSKGRNKRYYYYHCTSACGYRVRAEEINEYFFQGIERLSTNEEYIELYKEIIKATFQELFHQKKIDQAYITKSIDKLIERSAKGKELLTKGDIDIDDYLAIKDDCETKINTLGEELHKAYILGVKKDQDLDQIAMQLTDLKSFYTSKEIDLTAKRQLSALLLKEKLIFDTAGFSNNLNEVAQIIYGLSVEKYAIQIKAKAGEGSPDLRENKSPYKAIVSRIEKRSGQVISSALFTRLHHFLTEFARLCISIKTGYQPHFSS